MDIRKFDDNYAMTCKLQMEKLFDLHQEPTLQKVIIASLYFDLDQFVWY